MCGNPTGVFLLGGTANQDFIDFDPAVQASALRRYHRPAQTVQ